MPRHCCASSQCGGRPAWGMLLVLSWAGQQALRQEAQLSRLPTATAAVQWTRRMGMRAAVRTARLVQLHLTPVTRQLAAVRTACRTAARRAEAGLVCAFLWMMTSPPPAAVVLLAAVAEGLTRSPHGRQVSCQGWLQTSTSAAVAASAVAWTLMSSGSLVH